jgi:tetratricopeptide (TPR) repeat protein
MLTAILLVLPFESISQKKKRPGEESAQGLRMREAEFHFTEGEKFFILEDYAKALLYYQRSLEIAPDNGTVHYKIAEVLSRSNKQDDLVKASYSIDNAIRLDRKNKYFYLLAASIYNSLAKFSKAAEAYENMILEVKGTEEYLYELAAIYQYADETEKAIKTYDRAEAVFGVNEVSSIQKVRLFLESDKTKEALAEGEKLINAVPDDEHSIMSFTELLSQKGLRQEATTYLEKFLAINPSYGNAKMLLAGFYRDLKQEEKARPILLQLFDDPEVDLSSKVLVIGAYNNELHQNKLNNISDPEKQSFALGLFQKLVEANPSQTNVHVVGGDFYLSINNNREAQKEYQKAVELGEVSFEVWENLLYLETKLELWDLATRHGETALEMYPNQTMIHYFLGFAQMRKRSFNESIYSFEQAKKLAGTNASLVAEINGMLGDAYYAIKDYVKSDKAYEDALSNNPDNAIILNNYSFHLAVRKENLEKAEKMSSLLVKNNPDNPTFLDTHAWVLYVRQKYKEAKKIIERAVSTGKASASHIEHYGDILYQLGEVDNAVKQWERARGMNAKSENLEKKIANRKIYE